MSKNINCKDCCYYIHSIFTNDVCEKYTYKAEGYSKYKCDYYKKKWWKIWIK